MPRPQATVSSPPPRPRRVATSTGARPLPRSAPPSPREAAALDAGALRARAKQRSPHRHLPRQPHTTCRRSPPVVARGRTGMGGAREGLGLVASPVAPERSDAGAESVPPQINNGYYTTCTHLGYVWMHIYDIFKTTVYVKHSILTSRHEIHNLQYCSITD
jgi:hypothetical protein